MIGARTSLAVAPAPLRGTLVLALAILTAGCSRPGAPQHGPPEKTETTRTTPPSERRSAPSDKIDVLTGPFTETILCVVKDQRPFILMDLAPELPRLKTYTTAAREEYLLKRAMMVVRSDAVWKKKEYAGKDTFVIRMILLVELDEYGKPKWGSAPEIALVELSRSAVSQWTREAIAGLDRDATRKAVQSCRFSLDPIDEAPAK